MRHCQYLAYFTATFIFDRKGSTSLNKINKLIYLFCMFMCIYICVFGYMHVLLLNAFIFYSRNMQAIKLCK